MVRDVNGVYAWNNYIEAKEAQRAEQKKRASGKQPHTVWNLAMINPHTAIASEESRPSRPRSSTNL